MQAVARALEESWPERPEWVDMLADILQGSQLGPGDGWFRTAVAQTRFDWKGTRAAVGPRTTTGGSPAKSSRDRTWTSPGSTATATACSTETISTFRPTRSTPSPGAILFSRADRDGNGKLTREELDAFFKSCDSDGQGFLTLADLQEAVRTPSRARQWRVERAVEGDSGPRPVPPGDRLAPGRARARRNGPRLHSQDRQTAVKRSPCRSSSGRSRSSLSSATSPADRSAARPGTSRSSIAVTRTERPS